MVSEFSKLLFQIFNMIGLLLLQFSKFLCSTVYLLPVISLTRTLIGWTDTLSLINTWQHSDHQDTSRHSYFPDHSRAFSSLDGLDQKLCDSFTIDFAQNSNTTLQWTVLQPITLSSLTRRYEPITATTMASFATPFSIVRMCTNHLATKRKHNYYYWRLLN